MYNCISNDITDSLICIIYSGIPLISSLNQYFPDGYLSVVKCNIDV